MATTKTTNGAAEGSAALPDFKPETLYEVQLARSIEFPEGSGNWMRPGQPTTLRGDVAVQFKDAISDAIAVEN